MEANLMIKSFKTEGKKITDLQFYGDMEIDISGSAVTVEYEYGGEMQNGTLPYGVTIEKSKDENNLLVVTIKNEGDTDYYLKVQVTTGDSYILEAGKELALTFQTNRNVSKQYYFFLTKDLKNLVGYFSDY